MFTRGRSLRVATALVIATTLLASSLATTFGAVANVAVGGGNISSDLLTRESGTGATPTKVSPDNVAGFYLYAVNDDSANLSTFFLTATTTATPYGAYWKHASDTSWTACDISNGLKCTFGAFNSNTGIQVVAAFRLPKTTSTAATNCFPGTATATSHGIAADASRGHVCVDFQFASNSGYVVGKNKSRGDAYHWYDVVYTDTGADQAAQFPFCDLSASTCASSNSLLAINDLKTNFGKNNPQWTQVVAPAAALNSPHASTGLNVADGTDTAGFVCPTGFSTECANAILGQWSQVDVNSGGTFSAFIQIDIGVYGVGANKISTVYHFYKVGTDWNVEVIDTKCSTSSGPTGSSPCFWVTSLAGNSSQVSIWTHFNGNFRLG